MGIVYLNEADLPLRLREDALLLPEALLRGALPTIAQTKAQLERKSPVSTGQLKHSWSIKKMIKEIILANSMPYAAIIERGAAPHAVSRAGWQAIREWVERAFAAGKLKIVNSATAKARRIGKSQLASPGFQRQMDSITWAIVKTINAKGVKGKFFVEKTLTGMRTRFVRRIKQELFVFFERP